MYEYVSVREREMGKKFINMSFKDAFYNMRRALLINPFVGIEIGPFYGDYKNTRVKRVK